MADDQPHLHPRGEREENHQLSAIICPFCNKVFPSGKALGGHKRIHTNMNHSDKTSKSIKLKKQNSHEISTALADIAKRKPTAAAADVGVGEPTCFLCRKTFPSMKSLFGHMRSHPDRIWRGIQPPRPAVCSTSSAASLVSEVEPQDQDGGGDDDQVNSAPRSVDLTESLLGWSATAKRGRKQAFVDKEISAAQHLLSLARGEGDLFEQDEATNSNSFADKAESDHNKNKKMKFQELLAGYMEEGPPVPVKQLSYPDGRKSEDTDSLAGKSVNSSKWDDTTAGSWDYEADEDNESASRNTEQLNLKSSNGNGKGKGIIFTNKKKRKKIKDLESVHEVLPATPDKYRCSSCDKSFPTHYALGGHRSSNKICRITSPINNSVERNTAGGGDDDPMLEDEEENKLEGRGSSKRVGKGNQDQCKKYCHEETAHHHQSVVAPSSQMSSVGEHSHTCGGGGRVLDFDLNEVPPMELDDDDGFKTEHDDDVGGASFNSVEFPIFESSSSRL